MISLSLFIAGRHFVVPHGPASICYVTSFNRLHQTIAIFVEGFVLLALSNGIGIHAIYCFDHSNISLAAKYWTDFKITIQQVWYHLLF